MSVEIGSIGPEYQRVAAGISAAIIAGEYPIGESIPSTRKLEALYSASSTSVRRAVGQLQAAGVLVGHPGKGVFVVAIPGERQAEPDVQAELARLTEQVEELKAAAGGVPDLRATLHRVEASISRVEGNLMDLYGKNGFNYPHGEAGAGSGSHPQAAPRANIA